MYIRIYIIVTLHNTTEAIKLAVVETKYNINIDCFRHVQISNEDAIKFYAKFGFDVVEKKENYYKRIEPADAFVLKKHF